MAGPVVRLIVPTADGQRVLGAPNGLSGWQLPRITLQWSGAWEAGDVERAGRVLGGHVAPVRRVGDDAWELTVRDRVSASATQWVGVTELGRLGHDRSIVEAWLSRPIPTELEHPSWPAMAEAWADSFCTRTGLGQTLRHWELSSVLRVPIADGAIVVKQGAPGFDNEGAAMIALAGLPGVPPIVAHDGARFAMPFFEGATATDDDRATLLRLLGECSRAAADRTLDLPVLAPPAGDDRVATAYEQIESLGLPRSAIHADAHPGNLLLTANGPLLIDWSDAHIANPLLDVRIALTGYEDDEALLDHWSAAWADVVDPGAIRAAHASVLLAGSATVLGFYTRLAPMVAPALRPTWAGFTGFWVERVEADRARIAGSTAQPPRRG